MDPFKAEFKLARSYKNEYPDAGLEAGTLVRLFRGPDGGISDHDTLASGKVCTSITTDPNGLGVFYVVYMEDLILQ